ncbi:Cochaperone protein [Marasmius tenuissimus]|uniref:Cochaperone protein n=1 Tax=Marasmius tenuissimus TaxID=585030 RepID=A0ABR3AF10_9AGAR
MMPTDAEIIKKKGNEAFIANDFGIALELYTHALKLDPKNGIYLLNRSFVYLKLSQWAEAERDATNALSSTEISEAQKAKALLRRGKARKRLGEAGARLAREDFSLYLAITKEQKTLDDLERDADDDTGIAVKVNSLADHFTSLTVSSKFPFTIKRGRPRGRWCIRHSSSSTRRTYLGGSTSRSICRRELCQVLSLHNAKPPGALKGIFGEIYSTNAFAAAGLCFTASKFNHSCSPNARGSFHGEKRQYRIYALTDIAVGEEIFIPYIQGRNIYGSTREQRRSRLYFAHGFKCMCKTCSLPQNEVEKSDARRSKLKELYEKLPKHNPSAHGDRIISLVIQSIRLLREDGYLADADDFAVDAAHVCASVSDVESAKYWARLAYEAKRDEFGPDSAHAIRAKENLDDPMSRKNHPQAGFFRTQVLSGRL